MDRRMAQIKESVARYLQQLDTADRQEPSGALKTKTSRLKEKIEKPKEETQPLEILEVKMLATPDQQPSLTTPDSRSKATSVPRCRIAVHHTNEEHGLVLRRYWTTACQSCAIKHSCTTGKERRITRWEHEHVLEAVQRRLDEQSPAPELVFSK